MGFLKRIFGGADVGIKLLADSTTRDQPALGQYGWVWVLIIGIGLWVAYIRLQRQREKRESRFDSSRIADEQRRARWAAERNRRRYSDPRGRSRDFDPPGGWGAMGPGE